MELSSTLSGAAEVRSKDAVARWKDGQLELATKAVVHRFDFEGGGLRRTRWLNRKTGVDLLDGRSIEDFALVLDGVRVSSADSTWIVGEPDCKRLEHGELQTILTLRRQGLTVRRHYVVYPGLSLLRGWLEIENAGQGSVALSDPPITSLTTKLGPVELLWMSGAECFGDSWKMRSELLPAEGRAFDSYDPPTGASAALPGDGVDARILVNDKPIWPDAGWAHSAHSSDAQRHELQMQVRKGDRVQFVLGRHGHFVCDTTEWDPIVRYDDGEELLATKGFSQQQGAGGWSYEYLGDDGHWEKLVYDQAPGRWGERWRRKIGVTEPFVAASEMHPDPQGHAVRVFTAPRDGNVALAGSLRNTGNQAPPGKGFRLGTMAYAPWFCLRSRESGEAAYVGFDCMGHWLADFHGGVEGHEDRVQADLRVGGFEKTLATGESVRTPYSFTGLFNRDLDDMGQELLEWQYGYLWDYTREPWFPAVRMLGYWFKGTNWGIHGWVGGDPDMDSAFRKVFRTADLMRYTGGDTYHRDWGWWDRAGDWNGPDFRASGDYLRKYGMGQLIYAFIYTVDGESSVAKAHPDWCLGGTLDQSRREVIEYEVDLLHGFYERWGAYQWRNDSGPLSPRDGNDTVLLAQQQGFMEVLRRFLDTHPDCAFQGVNGGGMALNWEYLAYASGFQFTDGQSQAHANYHASYLFPPDKINNMPDIWDPAKYDPATWRGLLCSNFDLTGDTFDPEKLEGLRDLIDVYHYLQSRGVAGRWGRIYHPLITGDDETMYLQRLSWDRTRGIIITKHKITGTVTVQPKGLIAEAMYEVCFHESHDRLTCTGAELMEKGITLTDPVPGELIYLNLSDHPGSKIDHTPPTPPTKVTCASASYMGVPGVELTWRPAKDDHWVSHYTIWRDGQLIDRVARGCFYFDHSAGADPAAKYEVRAMDGSRNESKPAATPPSQLPRRVVYDDADVEHVDYQGEWERETDFPLAHRGTLSNSKQATASFIVRFRGRSVTWHSRLGAEGGLARVIVDNESPVEVSCFSADEIPQWPLFVKEWPEAGQHVLRVEVTGRNEPRSTGARVWVDGIAVAP